jgi:hypothetical protein
MSWQAVAERAAQVRCAAILERLRQAIGEHAPNAMVEAGGGELRLRGRGLKQRWLGEAGLRFARRIMR